jgi:hypothetical protein
MINLPYAVGMNDGNRALISMEPCDSKLFRLMAARHGFDGGVDETAAAVACRWVHALTGNLHDVDNLCRYDMPLVSFDALKKGQHSGGG